MEYSVRFHDGVGIGIKEAYAFYENRKQGLGENFLNAFRSKTESIRLSPDSFSYSGRQPYREAMIKGFPFIIVFREKAEIFVASVHHERKHPGKKFR